MDPDRREEYDSTITEDQFNKISNGSVLSEGKFIRTLNGQTWNEVQHFFQQNPNGVIYRNPDEIGYKFYSNKKHGYILTGKKKNIKLKLKV